MSSMKLTSFVLFVKDVPASKKFYEELLDQEVALNINDINVGFKSGLGLWQKKYADNLIFGKETEPNKEPGNSEIYFETSELDEIFSKVKENSVKILHPIKVQPWQQRVFRICDLDNNIVEIAETMDIVVKRLHKEGMSVELISEKTFMPADIVNAMLQ